MKKRPAPNKPAAKKSATESVIEIASQTQGEVFTFDPVTLTVSQSYPALANQNEKEATASLFQQIGLNAEKALEGLAENLNDMLEDGNVVVMSAPQGGPDELEDLAGLMNFDPKVMSVFFRGQFDDSEPDPEPEPKVVADMQHAYVKDAHEEGLARQMKLMLSQKVQVEKEPTPSKPAPKKEPPKAQTFMLWKQGGKYYMMRSPMPIMDFQKGKIHSAFDTVSHLRLQKSKSRGAMYLTTQQLQGGKVLRSEKGDDIIPKALSPKARDLILDAKSQGKKGVLELKSPDGAGQVSPINALDQMVAEERLRRARVRLDERKREDRRDHVPSSAAMRL